MSKKTIKAECITVHLAKDRISVQLAVAPETQPAQTPGQPPQRVTRTVININSQEAKQIADLKFLEPSKTYLITIE